MKKDGLTMSNYIIGIYTAFRSHGIITHYSTEICDCMHVHVCCWARGGPGWSVDFWCECFALPSACRFSDVSLLYLGWPNFLHVYKEEKHVRCRKHASQSLVAVGKGFASTWLSIICWSRPITVWCFPPGLLVSLHTSSLRPLQWWEKLLQSFSSLTTIMSCRLECSCMLADMNSHFSKLPIGHAHRI